jgi:predicted AAA+ superfamily ATPase
MIARHLTSVVREALADRPVVLLHGARQVGKSTLVRMLARAERPPRRYLTLDDAGMLAAAHGDPAGFVAGLDGAVALDEVQRVPELFLAIKAAVDRDRRPGWFLLTGSADVLLLPRLAESLAGRMEVLTLWPLSQGEIERTREGFVDAVFGERLPPLPKARRMVSDLIERIVRGGFPELVVRGKKARPRAWFGAYVTTILQRDIRDLAHIEGLTALPRLLALLASRPMGLLNHADLARNSGLAQSTLKRYMTLLETTFLVQTLPGWFPNVGKRLAKAPKVLLADTGLAAYLQGVDASRLRNDRTWLGPLLENFIVMELKKQVAWSSRLPQLLHFRTSEGREVDLILEDAAGRVVAIEVKAASTVGPDDLTGLRFLAGAAARRFHRGVLLYTGTEIVPFGANLHAVPLRALWEWKAAERG